MKAALLLSVGLFAVSSLRASPTLLREADVLYLEDAGLSEGIVLKVERVTGLFSDRQMRSRFRNLTSGEVDLIGFHPEVFYVRTRTRPASEGWVDPRALSAVKPELMDKIRGQIEENKKFAQALKDKKILVGMGKPQVVRVLGANPTQRSSRQDETGTVETWAYIRTEPIYEQIPVRSYFNGVWYVSYQRREVGRRELGSVTVDFKDDKVVAVQEAYNDGPNTQLPGLRN
jgi:hypothetical protein